MATQDAAPPSKNWTEKEKITLLLSMYQQTKSHLDWNALPIPSGRTEKAVTGMLEREMAKLKKDESGDGAGADGDAAPTAKTPRKRAAKPKKTDQDTEDVQDGGDPPTTPKPKAARKPRTKKEAKADDNEAGGETEGSPKTPKPKNARKPAAKKAATDDEGVEGGEKKRKAPAKGKKGKDAEVDDGNDEPATKKTKVEDEDEIMVEA